MPKLKCFTSAFMLPGKLCEEHGAVTWRI